MSTSAEFSSKMAAIKLAMEREEWARAIHDLENIGTIPDKFFAVVSNILFHLYISRNQHEKLARLSPTFDSAKSKDTVSALLLFRDRELGYSIALPDGWDLASWENAVEQHALAGQFEPVELQLCLYFLSILNRPRLLALLHFLAIEAGGTLNSESVEVVLRCYLRNGWFEPARRFLWTHNLNDIPFQRFDFIIDRAEKGATEIPRSHDKFLGFLHHRFGSTLPDGIPDFTST